jgi:hypothetical protein
MNLGKVKSSKTICSALRSNQRKQLVTQSVLRPRVVVSRSDCRYGSAFGLRVLLLA